MLISDKFLTIRIGQGMVEYGLIIGLVAITVVVIIGTMGTRLQGIFQSIITALTGGGA